MARRRRLYPFAVAVAAASLVAACGGDDGARIAEDRLPHLVLQPDDLPPGFVRFDEGRQARADAPPPPRSEVGRFGRTGGWQARYRRQGSPETTGPLVVESRAEHFTDTDGAGDELEAFEGEIAAIVRERPEARRLEVADLGDDAAGVTFVAGEVAYVTVGWREANVTATISANGFAVEPQEVVALAQAQQRRIERPAG